MSETLIGFAALFGLMLLRLPLAVAMFAVGLVGVGLMRSWPAAWSSASRVVIESGFNYLLSVVPLFVLMGNLVTRAGMSRELFALADSFLGHRRGGLAMATISACAGFGAICGSSIATAATMSKVAHPSMRDAGYDDRLSTGAIAAGGTLGILIPPSTIMVIYGIMTETSIGKLFAAGILPGLLMTVLMCMAAGWMAWRHPAMAPQVPRRPWAMRLHALTRVWAVVLLFLIVMGGIYGGWFTATEGAAVGAFGAFCFALARGTLTLSVLREVLVESARTTAMLFAILIGAVMFSNFVNFTTLPGDLAAFVQQFQLHPMAVIVAICGVYILLGTAMEELSMILLTVPIFFPLVIGLGFDPVWFGVLVIVVVMLGLVSPPVGMNLFVIHTLLRQVPMSQIFAGVTPFVVAQIVGLGLLIAFPDISLWLAARVP